MGRNKALPSEDEQIVILASSIRHPDGQPNVTAIAEQMGKSRSTIQSSIKRLSRLGRIITPAARPGFTIKSISESIDGLTGTVNKTWIKQGIEGEQFKIPDGHIVKGISALVDASGLTTAQWVKTSAGDGQSGLREALIATFEAYRGKAELSPPPQACDEDMLTVYPIADLHLGLLTWGRETGVPYDISIAKEVLLSALGQLIATSPSSKYAIVLNLGDLVHADDSRNETPMHGHKLDVETRYPKILREAVRLHVSMIEMALQKHDNVLVRCLPGNHDIHVAQMLTIALDLFFENNPRVTVDSSPDEFFWYKFGSVMIAANHGHRIKIEEMPGVMAARQPAMWGATKYRYCYGGHLHRAKKGGDEKHGVRWEIFQTIAAKDAYAHNSGYSSERVLTAITHHKDRGEIVRQSVSV